MEKKKNIKEVIDVFKRLESNPIDFMQNTTFKRSELQLDPRVANHWVEKGLFPRKFENGTWLIFNLPEAFWVKIMMKLREFNVSLDVIKKIKEAFFTEERVTFSDEMKDKILQKMKDEGLITEEHVQSAKEAPLWDDLNNIELSPFEGMLLSVLLERKPYFILLNTKGQVVLMDDGRSLLETEPDNVSLYREITSRSHIRISMNEILSDLVTSLGELTCSETIPILTKNEAQILKMLRGDNIARVEIKYNLSSQPELIEITSNNKIIEASRLTNLIISKGYQDIRIKTQNGQISYFENTIKHRLDTE